MSKFYYTGKTNPYHFSLSSWILHKGNIAHDRMNFLASTYPTLPLYFRKGNSQHIDHSLIPLDKYSPRETGHSWLHFSIHFRHTVHKRWRKYRSRSNFPYIYIINKYGNLKLQECRWRTKRKLESITIIPFGHSTFLCDMKKGYHIYCRCYVRKSSTTFISWQITDCFVWPNMSNNTFSVKNKIGKHTKWPICKFTHLQIDIVGTLPNAHGFNYMLNILDQLLFPFEILLQRLSQKLYWTIGSVWMECHQWLLLTEEHNFSIHFQEFVKLLC